MTEAHPAERRPALASLAAVALGVPVTAILWLEIAFLWFGFTGRDPGLLTNVAALALAAAIAFGWLLRGARRPAEVIRSGCRLGIAVALLLPVVAFAVLLLWEKATDRPDLGMGGLMLYGLPVVALVLAFVLAVLFRLVDRAAERRLEKTNE